jgi:hypothetical protein
MASKKPFVNPLTRSSEQELHIDTPDTSTAKEVGAGEPKAKKPTFEETHERFSTWVDKDLKKRFLTLVDKKGVTKTALLNEAIEALLHKEERKPYTRHSSADQ